MKDKGSRELEEERKKEKKKDSEALFLLVENCYSTRGVRVHTTLNRVKMTCRSERILVPLSLSSKVLIYYKNKFQFAWDWLILSGLQAYTWCSSLGDITRKEV